jgi:hypothetical protein
MVTLKTNLDAVLYFSRIASVYLRQGRKEGEDRGLVLTSSIAGLTDAPGIPLYSASKHGIMGILRALRSYAPTRLGIRVNAVCPWMTSTGMTAGIESAWRKANLPINSPEDVAKVIIDVCRVKDVNGGAFYVEGGRAWEVEKGLFGEAQDLWMGKEQRNEWDRGQVVLGLVSVDRGYLCPSLLLFLALLTLTYRAMIGKRGKTEICSMCRIGFRITHLYVDCF